MKYHKQLNYLLYHVDANHNMLNNSFLVVLSFPHIYKQNYIIMEPEKKIDYNVIDFQTINNVRTLLPSVSDFED